MSVIDLRRYRLIILLLIMLFFIGVLFYGSLLVAKTLYPIKHRVLIERYAKEYDLDPMLIAAIIRVESKFREYAVSSKGAKGLMQISSITGKWASEELEIPNYEEKLLFNPNINIKIGCWYLSKLKKEFNNNMLLVLAAYNGGSGNVNKWLSDIRYSADGTTLQEIPFPETEAYVEKVEKNFKIYKFLYKE